MREPGTFVKDCEKTALAINSGMEDLTLYELVTKATPYIAGFVGLVISLIAKDVATSFAAGLAFKRNPAFNEGDSVYLDDEAAIITKIGIRDTVFSIQRGDKVVWRYIRNDRIRKHKLERIVERKIIDNEDIRNNS